MDLLIHESKCKVFQSGKLYVMQENELFWNTMKAVSWK